MTTPLKIVGHIAPKQAEKAEKGIGGRIGLHPCGTGGKRYTVELTRLSSALAALAQRDAEIARLRRCLEKAHLSAILGDVDPSADLECCREHIEAALKGSEV